MKSYQLIGLMSGTSLDGLDIVCCKFEFNEDKWDFELQKFETISYSKELVEKILKLDPKASIIWGSIERFKKQLDELEDKLEEEQK